MTITHPLSEIAEAVQNAFDQLETFHRAKLERPLRGVDDDESHIWYPNYEISEEADQYIIDVDIPAISPDDIVVRLMNDMLIISTREREQYQRSLSRYEFEEQQDEANMDMTYNDLTEDSGPGLTYGERVEEIALPSGVTDLDAQAGVVEGRLEIRIPRI